MKIEKEVKEIWQEIRAAFLTMGWLDGRLDTQRTRMQALEDRVMRLEERLGPVTPESTNKENFNAK